MGKVYDDNLTSQQRLEKEGISQHLLQAYGAPNSNHWCNVLVSFRASSELQIDTSTICLWTSEFGAVKTQR